MHYVRWALPWSDEAHFLSTLARLMVRVWGGLPNQWQTSPAFHLVLLVMQLQSSQKDNGEKTGCEILSNLSGFKKCPPMSFPWPFIGLSSSLVLVVLSEHLPWVYNPPDDELLDVNMSRLQQTQSKKKKKRCVSFSLLLAVFCLLEIITFLNPSSCCTGALIFKPISRLRTDKEEDTSFDKLHKDWLKCIYVCACLPS